MKGISKRSKIGNMSRSRFWRVERVGVKFWGRKGKQGQRLKVVYHEIQTRELVLMVSLFDFGGALGKSGYSCNAERPNLLIQTLLLPVQQKQYDCQSRKTCQVLNEDQTWVSGLLTHGSTP